MAPYRQDDTSPHQCQRVCDWETTERDQPSEAQKNQPSDCDHHAFEKRCTSSFHPSFLFTQQGGTKERTGHPRSRGTPCLNCVKISKEGGKPTQLKRARRTRSFISLTTSLSFIVMIWRMGTGRSTICTRIYALRQSAEALKRFTHFLRACHLLCGGECASWCADTAVWAGIAPIALRRHHVRNCRGGGTPELVGGQGLRFRFSWFVLVRSLL